MKGRVGTFFFIVDITMMKQISPNYKPKIRVQETMMGPTIDGYDQVQTVYERFRIEWFISFWLN